MGEEEKQLGLLGPSYDSLERVRGQTLQQSAMNHGHKATIALTATIVFLLHPLSWAYV